MPQKLANVPKIKLGVVGVSRNCFPIELTRSRLGVLSPALAKHGVDHHVCSVIIENENDAMKAIAELKEKGCQAAFVYLGNFGPETPTTMFMQRFPGPCMVAAAAEEDKKVLASDRGDALCGLLNNAYNTQLRRIRAYVPQFPVGLPEELAPKAADFVAIARVVVGVRNLKLFGFGPRPLDFLACNAPVQPLYDLGIEIEENSELDLLAAFNAVDPNDKAIAPLAEAMIKDIGKITYPDLPAKLARFELALMRWKDANLGGCGYAAFANKCWPAFEAAFGFVPCYVNGHMTGQGYPVACEVDFYGALSEYMVLCATMKTPTLLDINNSVPDEVLPKNADLKGAAKRDLFMGFHCGNACTECLKECHMKHHVIMHRGMEPGKEPNITRGTMEGPLLPGEATFFRLQSSPSCALRGYVAEGEILDIDPCSFGSIGIFAIPGFARFYRHILVAKGYPHHGAVGFKKAGKILFEALKLLGVDDIGFPLPAQPLYQGENPFEAMA